MKRNVLIIGAAALVAIIALWYFVLYGPLSDDLTSAQSQVSTAEKKTNSLQADLTRLKSQAKNATQQQALLRRLDAAVPEQPDLAEFILQANQIADESGISFLSIAPTPPAAGTGVSVINMTITIQGSFFQLQDYLRQLENLERLVIVDGITISAGGTSTSGGTGTTATTTATTTSEGVTLSVTLTARMFTRAAPTTTADGSATGGTTPGATTSTTAPAGSTGSTSSTAPAGTPTTGGA